MDAKELIAFGGGDLAGVFSKSLATTAAKTAGNKIGKALGDAMGDPVAGAVRAVGRHLTPRAWQQNNFNALNQEVERIAADERVRAKAMPLSILYPLVEEAVKVDDKLLRAMWARLLVRGGKEKRFRRPILLHRLRDLSPEDARAFREICARAEREGVKLPVEGESRPFYGTNTPRDPVETSLEALGLIEWFHHRDRFITVPSHLGCLLRDAVMPHSGPLPKGRRAISFDSDSRPRDGP